MVIAFLVAVILDNTVPGSKQERGMGEVGWLVNDRGLVGWLTIFCIGMFVNCS
ncbi:hypothetical protein A2U01_0018144, partial [Trifolium medium]|nr:hypothetical protein [Trifolium medium]